MPYEATLRGGVTWGDMKWTHTKTIYMLSITSVIEENIHFEISLVATFKLINIRVVNTNFGWRGGWEEELFMQLTFNGLFYPHLFYMLESDYSSCNPW